MSFNREEENRTKKTENKLTITIIGAAGTAGSTVTDRLLKRNYDLLFCEKGEGTARLQERGLTVTNIEEAVPKSDIVIMTVPDAKIGEISKHIVPTMKTDRTMILLDPAAAYIGELALRDDCSFVIAHPCHPALFAEQDTPEARQDFFGGIAKQDIVIALLQGKEENFRKAEEICIEIFSPIAKCHRITVDQMTTLEPIAAEVVAASAAYLMKEAFDEAVKHGVPEEAARSFMLGHTRIILAIFFGTTSHQISDAAKVAIQYGYNRIFKPDWKEMFESGEMKEIVHEMLHPEEAQEWKMK
ncbi:MAG: oxidoreductase [Candidatus Bathyarchaeota archaeon]|nr:oxidoreductase [Candidatus Bathyarchaeota archaeon]MDH5686882.1 oxidoreductase [Candidatus Bathyarchaeota archaeon]